jgi:hypothetical protein
MSHSSISDLKSSIRIFSIGTYQRELLGLIAECWGLFRNVASFFHLEMSNGFG